MPSNEFYDSSGYPTTGAPGSSTSMRAELDAIEAGFLKLPTMAGNGDLPVFVNAGGTALETKSTAAALTALGGEDTTKKDAPGGYAGLTLFKINFMNAIGTIKSFFTNANTAARTYTFQDRDGTIADNIDLESKANISALESKANIASPTFTGTVSGVTKAMVGLGSVDNTSDVNKPVSTAQQTALNLKAPLASPTFTGTVSGVTKAMVGLGNVDNTSDVNKPVSTDQQTALDLKAPLASPTFTGTPTAPTPAITDNSGKIATTQHIAQAFIGSAGNSGYQKFKNGIVLQWGIDSTHATATTEKAHSFPLEFTTVYSLVVRQFDITGGIDLITYTLSTTGFKSKCSIAACQIRYIAVGFITPV